ncbi:MAG TPA: hypothetical protein VLV82_08310 [Candidatus Angelobacter sp.]|nr:hypothetical protein [Candidatus Angelobacter sp.]
MTAPHDATTSADLPSPAELSPADSPDLLADPPDPDAVVDGLDAIDEPVELAPESDPADAVDQILEVGGLDDEHDAPA